MIITAAVGPKFSSVPLKLIDPETNFIHNGKISGAELEVTAPEIQALGMTIDESKISKSDLMAANLSKSSFIDVAFNDVILSATKLVEASLIRVEFSQSRLSGLQIYDAYLKDISFDDCKLDLANFRFSKLHNVTFKNCLLKGVDFQGCEFNGVRMVGCMLIETDFSAANIKSLDLRGSTLTDLKGANGLAGAIIDIMQLMSISPSLAKQMGIKVSDTD